MDEQHITSTDNKDLVVKQENKHVEHDGDDGLPPSSTQKSTEFGDRQMKSDFDHLTVRQTISVYRRAIVICFLAAFTASTDGESYALAVLVIQ